MRPSLIPMATPLLALCAALVIASGGERSAAAGAPAAGACKSVATFTSSAVPALQKEGCTGCHSGPNGAAKTALDLTAVGTNNTAACVQALTRVNLVNKAESALIQAPAGTHAHMGGKVADPQMFTAAMLGWINNE